MIYLILDTPNDKIYHRVNTINKDILNVFFNVLHENRKQIIFQYSKDKIVGFHLEGQK